MPANRPPLSLVPDEDEQVPRLQRFRAEHPEVIILMRGAMPKSWVGGMKIARQTLRGLLDELEEIFPRGTPGTASRKGAAAVPGTAIARSTTPRPVVLTAAGVCGSWCPATGRISETSESPARQRDQMRLCRSRKDRRDLAGNPGSAHHCSRTHADLLPGLWLGSLGRSSCEYSWRFLP
jgi:hypothetical protein